MKQELVKKESAALATPMSSQAWGTENVDASDVVIPKLLLMQGQSDFVSSGKAKAGDICRSTNGEVLGGREQGVEIIPFMTFKTWVISENTGSRFEFRSVEPITTANVSSPLEWSVENRAWRRDRCLNFYALLPSDIKKEIEALEKLQKTGEFPDPSSALLPVVLSFRRTSYGAGKDLATHFMKAAHFNVPAAVSMFKLVSKSEKNDQGTYWIFTAETAGKTKPEYLDSCRKWYETISKTQVQVDNSDLGGKAKDKPRDNPSRVPPSSMPAAEDCPF